MTTGLAVPLNFVASGQSLEPLSLQGLPHPHPTPTPAARPLSERLPLPVDLYEAIDL